MKIDVGHGKEMIRFQHSAHLKFLKVHTRWLLHVILAP